MSEGDDKSTIVTIQDTMKLMLSLLKPTIDESNSEHTTVSSVITTYEDGTKYKVEVNIYKQS